MNANVTMQSPPNNASVIVGAAVGAVAVVAIALVGHKMVYGTVLGPAAGPAPAASETAAAAPAPVPLVVRANIAAARMNFRGATVPLPYDSTVAQSGMNDYVEISAPGYEGRRFWLKFDRPRSLVVTLPEGSGIIDASYDETEVALGRAVAKPSDSDTSAGGKATTSGGAHVAAAPQGGGGGFHHAPAAAPAQPAAAPAQPAAAPAQPAAAPAQPAAPAVTAAPQPAAPAVSAAPAAPVVPPGTVNRRGVNQTIGAHRADVQACYERARMDKPDLGGKVTIAAGLSGTGQVTSASVASSSAHSARLESCLTDAFRSWTFPPPEGNVPGNFNYTFNFE